MACETFPLPGGGYAIVCSRGRRSRKKCSEAGCTGLSVALCDFELGGAKAGKTCDRDLCAAHRRPQPDPLADGSQRDFCPAHHRAARAPAPQPTIAAGDPFVEAVKRGTAKLEAGDALPWWALITAAAAMRADASWSALPSYGPQPPLAGEIEAR